MSDDLHFPEHREVMWCETTATTEIPADLHALRVFVEAAEQMTATERDAAIDYLADRYRRGGRVADLVVAIREEFTELLGDSDISQWHRRLAASLFQRALQRAMTRNAAADEATT